MKLPLLLAALLTLLTPAGAALPQNGGMFVGRATQAQRDLDRRDILERELESEQALLRQAREALSGSDPGSAGASSAKEREDAVRLHGANVESIRRELARMPSVSVLKVAASGDDVPQSATPRPPKLGDLPGASASGSKRNPRREAIRAYGNPRLVVFPYDRNNTYPIQMMEGLNTHLEFPEGEYVKTLSVSNCGQDSPYWSCILSDDRRHIWIKPKLPEQTNVGTIVTNRRVYEISLHAVVPGRDWYQRVTWEGGWQDQGYYEFREPKAAGGDSARAEAQKDPVGMAPERLRFSYAIEGNAPFRPQMVFDDGKFTWIRLAPNVQELPALFVLSGDEVELVNYTQRGDYLLVNRLVPGLLLKLGRAEVKVRNGAFAAQK
jgi:type IV secretion system protein VirB9